MKSVLTCLCIVATAAALTSTVVAAEKAKGQKSSNRPAKAKQPVAELQEITVSGTIELKTLKAGGRKGGAGNSTVKRLVLTEADGNQIMLPQSQGVKEGETSPDLSTYVDKKVKITGMGTTVTRQRKGVEKKYIRLKKVTAVEELDAAEGKEGNE